jgi:hypothetical protein
MITYVRQFANKDPQGHAVFAEDFYKYMLRTTEFRQVPVKYFFLLPQVPETVMWPSHPPIFLDKVRMYSIISMTEDDSMAAD